MKPPDVNKIILEGGNTFTEFHYKNEAELESLAIKNKDALFGRDSIYFDIKNRHFEMNMRFWERIT